MNIEFVKLNNGWNAEPNTPDEDIKVVGSDLILEFKVNPWAYDGFNEGERAKLIFKSCSKYRFGSTNDEGWYRGQCRFGKLAKVWGEFYLIEGDLGSIPDATDWVPLAEGNRENHYLFYMRDGTFECEADEFEFRRISS